MASDMRSFSPVVVTTMTRSEVDWQVKPFSALQAPYSSMMLVLPIFAARTVTIRRSSKNTGCLYSASRRANTQPVESGAAIDERVKPVRKEPVVAIAAVERIRAAAAVQLVVTIATEQFVFAVQAFQQIVTGVAIQQVAAGPAG